MSACLLAIHHLLNPLAWAGPVVVILPNIMSDFLDSPVPVLLGMETLPPSYVMSSGTIIVDPLQKLIHMHPTDVVSSHTLLLPLASKLMQQLKPQADIIIKLSRKLRKKTRKSFDQGMAETQSGVSQTQAAPSVASSTSSPRRSSTSNASGSALSQSRFSKSILVDECTTATATATATPSPDDDYAMSPLLSGAISKFALILKDHLQKIVNTTIQMSWEDKKQRYQHTTNLHNAPKERTLQRSLSGSSLGTDDT